MTSGEEASRHPRGRKVVVLDDDPTGSQEATDVPVMTAPSRRDLVSLLATNDSVYVITNSRSFDVSESRRMLGQLKADIAFAERKLGCRIFVVQRGDSTLRGHVFAEIDAFADATSIVVFVPAFPAGGRITVNGEHRVLIAGVWTNAADTEFAADPVFGFHSRTLTDYVAEKGGRLSVLCTPASFFVTAASTAPGSVVIPDVSSDEDVAAIARDILTLVDSGRSVVVRCAAPLSAQLAGVKSHEYLALSEVTHDGAVLVVAGSHTNATTAQLERLATRWPDLVEIDTAAAIKNPEAESIRAATEVGALLKTKPVVVVSTERQRRAEHSSLDDAALVMQALSSCVARVSDLAGVVVSKGGITSAEIARVGLRASTARVEGQVEPGISLWSIARGSGTVPFVVVPGNVGEADTLVRLVEQLVDQ